MTPVRNDASHGAGPRAAAPEARVQGAFAPAPTRGLPTEVWRQIIADEVLTPVDLSRVAQVGTRFRALADAPDVWEGSPRRTSAETPTRRDWTEAFAAQTSRFRACVAAISDGYGWTPQPGDEAGFWRDFPLFARLTESATDARQVRLRLRAYWLQRPADEATMAHPHLVSRQQTSIEANVRTEVELLALLDASAADRGRPPASQCALVRHARSRMHFANRTATLLREVELAVKQGDEQSRRLRAKEDAEVRGITRDVEGLRIR